jgi:WS/DGAT/MGAT family acyltransferase
MPHYIAERLAAEDASYLLFESPNAHMHLAWVWLFDGGSLVRPDGGVDIEAVRRHVAARLFRFPRFRQRLAWTPIEGRPAWVDDESFKLRYHVQHAALPEPGDEARLRIMVSQVVSQPLDRSKPLWELWVIEGLPDRRFAVVTKIHHCMMDGRSTVDLMRGLLDVVPHAVPEEAGDWIPRPAPGPEALLRDGLVDRARVALQAVQASARWLGGGAWRDAIEIGGEVLRASLAPPPATPLNRPVGPHRIVSWVRMPLVDLERAALRAGCGVQDLGLAAVSGAVMRLLARAGTRVTGDEIRVVVPVAAADARDGAGNRTAAAVISLPVALGDVRRRLRAVSRVLAEARRDGQLHNFDFLLQVAALGGRLGLGAGLAARRRLYGCNLIVGDIPAPRAPVHLLDARLVAAYPLVPLLDDQGLGLAFSAYDGGYHVGLVADWEIVPDLEVFASDLRAELDLVCAAAFATPRPVARGAQGGS